MFPKSGLKPPGAPVVHVRTLESLEARITPQAGALDPGYGVGGIAQLSPVEAPAANRIAFQGDGKVILASSVFNTSDSSNTFTLIRLTAEGAPDPTFGVNGTVTLVRPFVPTFNGKPTVMPTIARGTNGLSSVEVDPTTGEIYIGSSLMGAPKFSGGVGVV